MNTRPKQQNNPIKVLLADDDKDDRFFFERALKKISIANNLTSVADGEQLMDYLSTNSEHLPDVLFLDLNMPRKNGSECLSEIKGNVNLKRLPVIIYSTSLQDKTADELYENGAHYYLKKCDLPELKKYLQRVLTLLTENSNRPSKDKFVVSLQEA